MYSTHISLVTPDTRESIILLYLAHTSALTQGGNFAEIGYATLVQNQSKAQHL